MAQRLLGTTASLKPYLIVFVASACGLILEIVAARLLAPNIGVSLYTWTSIIGVVLAGISIGNYLGGRVADRFPDPKTLGIILLAGGLTCLSVLPLIGVVSTVFEALPIVPRIVFLTAALFFVPSAVLGMVTPLVVKLNLRDLDRTGDVVGKIYAVSTAGAIFGVFITGFLLVQWLGTRQTILLVALILVGMSLAFGGLWRVRMPTVPLVVLFVGIGGFSSFSGDFNSGCLKESNYFCIPVTDDIVEGRYKVKALHLDKLLHSYVSLEDPTLLTYDYEKVFADLINLVNQHDPEFRILLVGGGGYTVPRYLETVYPASTIEVIEIDPAVTRVAFDHLGMSRDTRIVTYNEDARMAVPKLDTGRYSLVVGDAFNDLSVPYHLTTREFNDQIAGLLDHNGIYAVNVVDRFQSGKFARAFVNTLKETFPHVYVIREDDNWPDDRQRTHVVAASLRPISFESVREASLQAGRGEPVAKFMPDETLQGWLDSREKVFLTDNHAPVDNMLAPLHLEGTGPSRANSHYNDGVELEAHGRTQDAIAAYGRAIELEPGLAQAYVNRGSIFYRTGLHQRAIQDFDQALALEPNHPDGRLNRGAVYLALGQYEQAMPDLDAAIRLAPESAAAHYNRAIADFHLGQYRQSVQDYTQAIRLDPKHALAYAGRAISQTILGEDEQAESDFRHAVELGIESSDLLRQEIDQRRSRR